MHSQTRCILKNKIFKNVYNYTTEKSYNLWRIQSIVKYKTITHAHQQ